MAWSLRLHRAVDHLVADRDARAADQRRIDDDRGLDPCGRTAFPARRSGSASCAVGQRKARSRSAPSPRLPPRPCSSTNCVRICGSSATRSASISTRTKLRCSASSLSPQIDSNSADLSAAVSRGLSSAAATCASVTTDGQRAAALPDHAGSALPSRRQRERRLGVGPGDGGEFGHGASRQSCCLIAASRSACALASTSRCRIFSAPATARSPPGRAATPWRGRFPAGSRPWRRRSCDRPRPSPRLSPASIDLASCASRPAR